MVTTAAPVRYRLYPIQDDFVADESRYVAFIGGRNSGKTYGGSIKAMLRASRGGLGCIAAPSFPMLEHGAKRQFIERLDETGVRYNQNRSGVSIPEWGSEVVFVTLESESRVRGPNYDWAWPDEVEYVTDRNVWRALKGAVRAGDNPQVFVTSTPKGRRIVFDEWVSTPTPQHSLHRATTFDNLFIDAADYVAGLGYEGVFYDQEIAADFVSFEGLVYPGFSRATHVRQVDTEGWATILGMDVGTTNPTAVIVCRYAGDRRHYQAEHYERGMSSDAITELAVRLWNEHRPQYLVIDPSAAGLILSLENRGVRVRKATNDVLIGIANMTSIVLGKTPDGGPRLTVDPSCIHTIAEFESYRYKDGNRGGSDNPVKEFDHLLDAARYIEFELSAPPKKWGLL